MSLPLAKEESKKFIKIIDNKLFIYSNKKELIDEKELLNITFKNNYINWILNVLFDYRIPKSLIITLVDNTKFECGHVFKKDYNYFKKCE